MEVPIRILILSLRFWRWNAA